MIKSTLKSKYGIVLSTDNFASYGKKSLSEQTTSKIKQTMSLSKERTLYQEFHLICWSEMNGRQEGIISEYFPFIELEAGLK